MPKFSTMLTLLVLIGTRNLHSKMMGIAGCRYAKTQGLMNNGLRRVFFTCSHLAILDHIARLKLQTAELGEFFQRKAVAKFDAADDINTDLSLIIIKYLA